MTCTSTVAEACRELFAHYPLAVLDGDADGSTRAMLLAVSERDDVQYFVLSHDHRRGEESYSLRQRRATDTVHIEADGGAIVPDVVVNAVTHGVPIPRDGSLFGWRRRDVVTALVPVYTTSTPEFPEPLWIVMPRTDVPEAQWPAFTSERFFGHWFWDHYWAGRIISLGDLIARRPDTVFWTDTKAILGSACCTVANDIASSEGYMLRRGIYACYKALRVGKAVPSLTALLADADKTDLAPRFRRFVQR
jgi:hypothetical protein